MFADLVQILKAAEKTACMTFWLVLIVFMNQNMWLARWRTTVTSTRNRCIHTTHVDSWWDFWRPFYWPIGLLVSKIQNIVAIVKSQTRLFKRYPLRFQTTKGTNRYFNLWNADQSNNATWEENHDISNINYDISYYIFNSLRSAERNTIPVEYNQ